MSIHYLRKKVHINLTNNMYRFVSAIILVQQALIFCPAKIRDVLLAEKGARSCGER